MMKIDVYETEDLPESDQIFINENVFESESIEAIKINVEEALKKFEGKYLDSRTIDFSDNLTNKKHGYGFIENPHVTLTRKIESIRQRIKHLAEEVKLTKSKLEESDGCDLYNDVGDIRNQLSFLASNAPHPESSIPSDLINKLNSWTMPRDTSNNLKVTDGDVITYQLLQWPDEISVNSRKVALVEARIKRCENVIGDSSKLVALKKENEIQSIMELLKYVVSKATILNLNQLLKLEPRLTYIQQRAAGVLNSKTDSDLTDKVDKAFALHQKLQPSLVLLDKIKIVFNNLQLLEVHHKSAYEFHETLAHLQARQANILNVVQNNIDLLRQAELQMNDETSMFGLAYASIKSQ